MAKAGFNICMVARNDLKMNLKLAEIEKKYPGVKTMYIVADFSKMTTIKDYKLLIGEHLKTSDIAALFCNVGAIAGGLFID